MTSKELRNKVASMYPNSQLWIDKVQTVMPIYQVEAIYNTSYEKRMSELALQETNMDIYEAFPECLPEDMKAAWDSSWLCLTSEIRRALMDICEKYEAQVYDYMHFPEKYAKPDWDYVTMLFTKETAKFKQ